MVRKARNSRKVRVQSSFYTKCDASSQKIINGSEYAKNRIEFELWNMHINMLLLHSSQTLYLLIILY